MVDLNEEWKKAYCAFTSDSRLPIVFLVGRNDPPASAILASEIGSDSALDQSCLTARLTRMTAAEILDADPSVFPRMEVGRTYDWTEERLKFKPRTGYVASQNPSVGMELVRNWRDANVVVTGMYVRPAVQQK